MPIDFVSHSFKWDKFINRLLLFAIRLFEIVLISPKDPMLRV